MIEIARRNLRKVTKEQKGQVLPIALMLLVLGGLLIIPTFYYCSTSLKGQQVVESKALELYAADAGVEDGLWQIENDQLTDLFAGYTPAYDPYAYSDYDPLYKWEYSLTEDIKDINDKGVDVTIKNVWIPNGLAAPSPGEARQIIENGKLIITGSVITLDESPGYEMKIIYYYERDEEEPYYDPGGENLKIETIGIWLPPGFSYIAGSSSLEDDPLDPYYSVPVTQTYKSGEAVVWNFSSVRLKDFPGGTGYPMQRIVTFQFSSDRPDRSPGAALSWITTTGVGDVPFAWDADTKVYEITSVATDPATGNETSVQAYTAKTELRELSSAIAGDYRAVGGTLMVDQYHDSGGPKRDTLLAESDAEVDDIPDDAEVEAAYLYWSAWLASGSAEQILFFDDCASFDPNWDHGDDWHESSSYTAFYGHHSGSGGRQLKMKSHKVPDLSSYSEGEVAVSWWSWTWEDNTLESSDCLQYAFYDGSSWGDWNTAFCDDIGEYPGIGFSYTIPEVYLTDNFRIKFKIVSCADDEYVYIANVKISVVAETIADTSVSFKINHTQVYFDELGEPQQGGEEVTASEWAVLENEPGEYSYSCYLDVTGLVEAFSDLGDGSKHTGNGTYTVGNVYGDTDNEWSYAAWSLIIIYSSPETKGHQLYLYDDFVYSGMDCNVDFDNDGEPGGSISGFLVPDPIAGEVNTARITCFVGEGDDYYDYDYLKFKGTPLSDGKSTNDVWNSWSLELSEDGIDVDTFYVTWSSGLLEPGDTSAQVDLPTETDSWNLVYIILSFRSDVTSGGTLSYLIIG